ncbi:MAG: TIM barrel protein [Chloroflexota bacterium]|nr:TIM barrel protein [Chloroflexota bacterium]
MQLGVNSGIFGRPLDWEARISAAGELGYAGIELNVDATALLPRIWDQSRRAALRALAAEHGVAVTSLCMNCHWAFNLASPDPRVREVGRDLLLEAIGLAADLGAPTILVPACDTDELTTESSYRQFRQGLASCLAEAERSDVRLAVEAVGKPFLFSSKQIRQLLDELQSPALGIYLDVGNATSGGMSAPDEIRTAGDLALLCHVKDSGGRFFGEGTVDFSACMQALKDIGYDGFLNVELPPDREDPLSVARASKQWLDDLLSRS